MKETQVREWKLGGAVVALTLPFFLTRPQVKRLKQYVDALAAEMAIAWDEEDDEAMATAPAPWMAPAAESAPRPLDPASLAAPRKRGRPRKTTPATTAVSPAVTGAPDGAASAPLKSSAPTRATISTASPASPSSSGKRKKKYRSSIAAKDDRRRCAQCRGPMVGKRKGAECCSRECKDARRKVRADQLEAVAKATGIPQLSQKDSLIAMLRAKGPMDLKTIAKEAALSMTGALGLCSKLVGQRTIGKDQLGRYMVMAIPGPARAKVEQEKVIASPVGLRPRDPMAVLSQAEVDAQLAEINASIRGQKAPTGRPIILVGGNTAVNRNLRPKLESLGLRIVQEEQVGNGLTPWNQQAEAFILITGMNSHSLTDSAVAEASRREIPLVRAPHKWSLMKYAIESQLKAVTA